MKTVQELYSEIMASQDLKAQFIEAAKAGKLEAVLKEQGCEATAEQAAAFLQAKQNEDAPLSLDELDNAAGGECTAQTGGEAAVSALTIGIGCGVWRIVSLGGKMAGKASIEQEKEDDGRLCNF